MDVCLELVAKAEAAAKAAGSDAESKADSKADNTAGLDSNGGDLEAAVAAQRRESQRLSGEERKQLAATILRQVEELTVIAGVVRQQSPDLLGKVWNGGAGPDEETFKKLQAAAPTPAPAGARHGGHVGDPSSVKVLGRAQGPKSSGAGVAAGPAPKRGRKGTASGAAAAKAKATVAKRQCRKCRKEESPTVPLQVCARCKEETYCSRVRDAVASSSCSSRNAILVCVVAGVSNV